MRNYINQHSQDATIATAKHFGLSATLILSLTLAACGGDSIGSGIYFDQPHNGTNGGDPGSGMKNRTGDYGDYDGDNITNIDDVDYDGDGLIEISSAVELDMIRNNLAGTGLSDSLGEQGNTQGCNGDAATPDICLGYELANNINLSDYTSWVPLGACTGVATDSNTGEQGFAICPEEAAFSSIFDGNNYVISDMHIGLSGNDEYGIGLFGAVAPGTVLRNVRLQDVAIAEDNNVNSWFVGALVGVADGAIINSSSVVGGSVFGSYNVGGLIGSAELGASIDNASAVLDRVQGTNSKIGGLVGSASTCTISSSYARIVRVESLSSFGGKAGGLVGQTSDCSVRSSYADTEEVLSFGEHAGGLIGLAIDSEITSSYAISRSYILSGGRVGGLIGFAAGNTSIYASYARSENINAGTPLSHAAGLVGDLSESSNIDFSYAFTNAIIGIGDIGGLTTRSSTDNYQGITNSYAASPLALIAVNKPQSITIDSSYWDSDLSDLVADSNNMNGRTTAQMQSGSFAASQYQGWDAAWCNPATGEFTTDEDVALMGGYATNSVWDFGNIDQYPALTCLKSMPAAQQFTINGGGFAAP